MQSQQRLNERAVAQAESRRFVLARIRSDHRADSDNGFDEQAAHVGGAFPQLAPDPEDGESLVYGPDGKGGATLVARIKIEDWPKMRS